MRQFLESYGSYLLLFFIIIGYLFLKKFLTTKRFSNFQYFYDNPEEVARMMVKTYQKKNPQMLVSLSNLETIKNILDMIVAQILTVN